MEAQDLALTEPRGNDPRRPIALLGLGYLALCVGAVWIDYKVKVWRAKRRKQKRDDHA
jgi:hypothetical protein